MQESGLLEIIPLICTLTIWGQYPVFHHPESPQGAQLGVAAPLMAWWPQHPLFTDAAGGIFLSTLVTQLLASLYNLLIPYVPLFLHLSILETWLWTSLFLYVQQLFLWKNSISPASSMWFLQVWRSRSSLLSRTHGWSWGPKLGQSVFFYWQWHTYTLVWRHTRAQDSCNWFIQ